MRTLDLVPQCNTLTPPFSTALRAASVDVVMTNSTWTQGHIKSLWGPRRERRRRQHSIAVVYPPCAVRSIESAVEVSEASEQQRGKYLVYIAQFRPEKNHQLILRSFARFLRSGSAAAAEGATLVLLGSVRDSADSRRVYELRLLVNELHIKDRVVFQLEPSRIPGPDEPAIHAALDSLPRNGLGVLHDSRSMDSSGC